MNQLIYVLFSLFAVTAGTLRSPYATAVVLGMTNESYSLEFS